MTADPHRHRTTRFKGRPSNPCPVDPATVERAVTGDRDAWGQVYLTMEPLIRDYVRNRVKNADDAEDLVSTVFARALAALPAFKGTAIHSWLYTIANFAVQDYTDGPVRRHETSLEAIAEKRANGNVGGYGAGEELDEREYLVASARPVGVGVSEIAGDPAVVVEVGEIAEEWRGAYAKVLERLDKEGRAVVELQLRGKSYLEIGVHLGESSSEPDVCKRRAEVAVDKARKRVREILRQLGPEVFEK